MRYQKLRTFLFIPGERKSDRFFRWFPWIFLVAAYGITMAVLCLHGRAYIDSDMASEMVLADLLNKEGGLLSTNWWYSTELRVFCLQPFYRLGLLLFPQDWYAARMVGQGLCMLSLLGSYLYVGHGLKLRQCGVWGAFGVLTAGAIIFALVRLLFRWQELQSLQRTAPFLLAGIFVVQGLIFACVSDPQTLNASYWLTVAPFVFPVLQLEGETEHFHLKFSRRAAAVACCVCFAATSISTVQRFWEQGMRSNPHLQEVGSWLQEQGYTQGYSTFWNGNVLTEWSDGAIEMWVTEDFHTMQPSAWLQKTSHEQPPEGPVFLLTTMDELGSMDLSQLYWWSNVVYEEGEEVQNRTKRYVVMEYKDYDDMMAAVHGAQSWAETGSWGET